MLLGWDKIYNDIEAQQWMNKIEKQYKDYGYSFL